MKAWHLIFIGLVLAMGTANAGVIQSTETSVATNEGSPYADYTNPTNANDTDWTTAASFVCGGTPCSPPSMTENYTYNSIWSESYATDFKLEILVWTNSSTGLTIGFLNYSNITSPHQEQWTTINSTDPRNGIRTNISIPKEQIISGTKNISFYYTGSTDTYRTYFVNETRLYWLYNSSIINLTFDKTTNITVMWAGGTQYYENTNNIYNFTKYYPVGELSITFGNNQVIQIYNNNYTDIYENVTVEAVSLDTQQIGYLWSQNMQIDNERIRLYKAIGSSYKLYQSILSGRDGYFAVNVANGIYLFVVNKTGYDYYSQLKPTSSTNTLYLYLSNGTDSGRSITVYTNCPLKSPTTETCTVNTRASRPGTTIRYLYYINNTYQTPIQATTSGANEAKSMTITISPSYYIWNVTTEVDGTNWTNIITEWENLTNRSVQINIPTTPVSREDLPLVALIIIAMAATIAAIVNQYAPGFGIYTYGAILAGWTGFSGIFWAPATIAGFMIALTVAKKIVG